VNVAFFNAVVTALDFSDAGAADTINAWVEEKTHGKIDTIVEPPIHPLTVMFLINAIYFKGTWTYEFDPDDTREATFHTGSGQDKTVEMMNLSGELPYLETEDFQAVRLPYGYELFSMTVLLPKGERSADDLMTGFNQENWNNWMDGFATEDISLSLPKFEIEYKLKLNDILIALGMQDAFDPLQADFTGIRATGELYISEVKHKTYVKVNEEGTEAAAVTSVEVKELSARPPMVVDRPFLFVIHDSHSRALLFMGKIVDPAVD
jgi:serpin B